MNTLSPAQKDMIAQVKSGFAEAFAAVDIPVRPGEKKLIERQDAQLDARKVEAILLFADPAYIVIEPRVTFYVTVWHNKNDPTVVARIFASLTKIPYSLSVIAGPFAYYSQAERAARYFVAPGGDVTPSSRSQRCSPDHTIAVVRYNKYRQSF